MQDRKIVDNIKTPKPDKISYTQVPLFIQMINMISIDPVDLYELSEKTRFYIERNCLNNKSLELSPDIAHGDFRGFKSNYSYWLKDCTPRNKSSKQYCSFEVGLSEKGNTATTLKYNFILVVPLRFVLEDITPDSFAKVIFHIISDKKQDSKIDIGNGVCATISKLQNPAKSILDPEILPEVSLRIDLSEENNLT